MTNPIRPRTVTPRLLASALVMLAMAPALAQQPSQAQIAAIRQACRSDYQAHCASVPTGGSAALGCLKQNMASLSAPCQQAVGAVSGGTTATNPAPAAAAPPPPAAAAPSPPPMSPRQKAMLLRQACGYDFRRFCRGVPFGSGRVAACLEGNADRLRPACGRALEAIRR